MERSILVCQYQSYEAIGTLAKGSACIVMPNKANWQISFGDSEAIPWCRRPMPKPVDAPGLLNWMYLKSVTWGSTSLHGSKKILVRGARGQRVTKIPLMRRPIHLLGAKSWDVYMSKRHVFNIGPSADAHSTQKVPLTKSSKDRQHVQKARRSAKSRRKDSAVKSGQHQKRHSSSNTRRSEKIASLLLYLQQTYKHTRSMS